jgi:Fe-S cluster biogenesis protein NfuA
LSALSDIVVNVIEEKINPLLAADRGSVELAEVREEEGVVVVRYRGRCAGCPAMPLTHQKVVTAVLLAADRSIRKVEYTLLEDDDEP